MQKRKRWQSLLIFFVLILTVYNILPTVFYYIKPLKQPINEKQAEKISYQIAQRVNDLEKFNKQWISSYCNLLEISPEKISINRDNPQELLVSFTTRADAQILRRFLPRAGSLIPFVPAQLSLPLDQAENQDKTVSIQRQIPIHFSKDKANHFFSFANKRTPEGILTNDYRQIIFDRAAQITSSLGGVSDIGLMVEQIVNHPKTSIAQQQTFALAQDLRAFIQVFTKKSSITKRYLSGFSQNSLTDKKASFKNLLDNFDLLTKQLRLEKVSLKEKLAKAKKDQDLVTVSDLSEKISLIDSKEMLLITAEQILKKNETACLSSSNSLLDYHQAYGELESIFQKNPQENSLAFILNTQNPFIKEIRIDWSNENIHLILHPDLLSYISNNPKKKDKYEQLLINQIAKIKRKTDENILPLNNNYVIDINELPNSQSFLIFHLDTIAHEEQNILLNLIKKHWQPKHPDLQADVFPIYDYQTYSNLPQEQQSLCLVIYSPILEKSSKIFPGMGTNSLYILGKGLERIFDKYQDTPSHPESLQLKEDLQNLRKLLGQNGFIGYPGASLPSKNLLQDYIFEKEDYYRTILSATRENFSVKGSKRFALLEFTNVEQRLLTTNTIETKMHEDLLKWQDEYNSAQVSINPQTKYDVPKPIRSPLWNNCALSIRKYFRGDERKILHWGLDLSGGKTVQIELRDQNNKIVKNEADLKQGINELYNRVNKMGVSEVNIREVGSNIVLDFPGANNLSATELVKASSMFFHVVNEKFAPNNIELSDNINHFLQDVWNEAVVTNKKDPESINAIAWKHLYGDSLNEEDIQPRTEAAKILYQNGFRLAHPYKSEMHSTFNDTLSKIAVLRGKNFSQWQGQSHPLIIVFQNYALEGSALQNVHASYDPSKGNYLSFEVKRTMSLLSGEKIKPQNELYNWTSHYAKDSIIGTLLENYSQGRGWRMAVILNDSVISSPTLEASFKDRAIIQGSFSQREVNQLVADLKAGSLSFTPKILSEKNVSPELGKEERSKGIFATGLALIAVILAMVSYYRFSGLVASIAVLFNLLFMWATLQNIQATLSLAGIAGIILTVGMAVDANVLVFERIREEFSLTGKIASSIQMGYKKAFNAIFDSNITTIIAALILLHFDAGPIKGFAITLIIGIASSMFSALFMTKHFFMHWLKNPKHKKLKMANIIKGTHFNFLNKAKIAFVLSAFIMIVGAFSLYQQKSSIFGMDFTGGYAINITLEENAQKDYRASVEAALIKAGANREDFQIRELSPSNHLRVLLSTKMAFAGKPFYKMPLETTKKNITYLYENNPRISWIITALKNQHLSLDKHSLASLDSSWTSMSGQMSDTMRNNAAIGLFIAMLAILIYITFRFEFKFAISAIICLFHDVLITFAIVSFLHFLKLPIQIDLHTIAALMTIIGYSLNDTIIIFDRIREDLRIMRKSSFSEIVNHALNTTLSRTTITSGTTMLVLIILILFGGSTIFGFATVMAIGVVFGTLSSLFIASPVMLFFHRKEKKNPEKVKNKKTLRLIE